jgi:nitrogenase molybdenum-iron protein NifN
MSQRNFVNLNVNPCNMCMPMGAAGVFRGIENCMLLMHGSQGCSTYIRRHMATHYNEPIDIASSSLNEKGTVMGGSANLKKALGNVIRQYRPRVIGIATTCLAETIGENTEQIVREYMEEEKTIGLDCVTVSSPGYGGSQYAGHYLAARRVIEHFAVEGGRNKSINVIVGGMSPGDIRHIKELLCRFGVRYVLFPDISETLDGEYCSKYARIPFGGTRVSDLKEMGKAVLTLEIGKLVDGEISPGEYLKQKFGIPLYRLPLPIGLKNTDELVNTLSEVTGKSVPEKTRRERGRYLDAMVDSHKYNAQGRVGIFGDPELVYGVTALCLENGMSPCVAASGPANKKIIPEIEKLAQEYKKEFAVLADTDYQKIAEIIRTRNANLLVGPSDGAFMTEHYGIPLIRAGFPVHDRIGMQRKVYVGYVGSMNLMDEMTNTLLAAKQSTYRKSLYKKYYKK